MSVPRYKLTLVPSEGWGDHAIFETYAKEPAEPAATVFGSEELLPLARLFTAAPDLLDACEEALKVISIGGVYDEYKDIASGMRKAIAKAKGEVITPA